MATIKFLHQPGYIYDLISLFILRFNKDLWLDYYINQDKSQEDLAYLKSISEEFPITNEELNLFFSADEVKGSFLINKYFFDSAEKTLSEFDFDSLVSEILDTRTFTQRLFDFYLPDTGLEANWEDRGFLSKLIDLLSVSCYTEKTKNSIISFFIMPEKYISLLVTELKDKNEILTRFYQKNYKKIIDTQESFDFDQFTLKTFSINNKAVDCSQFDTAFVSVCLVAKNALDGFYFENSCLQIIGFDYAVSLEESLSKKTRFEVDLFGKIISDRNRTEVINMLMETPELSTSDIAKNLGISINAAYYHLDMMSQANMLNIRNEGRTVYYRLNRGYITKALDSVGSMFIKK